MQLSTKEKNRALRDQGRIADAVERIAIAIEALMDQVHKEYEEQQERDRSNGKKS